MRVHVAAAAIVWALASGCTSQATERVVVDPTSARQTPSGAVVGYTGRYGSHVWRGLPFAKPPVGDLRWRPPEAPEAWSGTREALTLANPCPQFASELGAARFAVKPGTPIGSEDCLYLSVFAPRMTAADVAGQRLPVMVWIHGGGNSIGEAGFYDGGHLAQTQNLVVVAINYRLGPFGWFRHPKLRDGASAAEASGNFGTLDHVRALEWVKTHIASFGGDASNVTVFGESAGGQNTFMLLLAPAAKGLFHRAIVQSGGLWVASVVEGEAYTDDAEPGHPASGGEVALRLLTRDGKAADRAAAKAAVAGMTASDFARFMRTQTAEQILAAYDADPNNGMIEMPRVFRDGVVLPKEFAVDRLAAGDGWNRVPVILGTNRDEAKLFMFRNPGLVRTRFFGLVNRLIDPDRYDAVSDSMARIWKATGVDDPAAAMRRAGAEDVWAYRFDWDEEPTVLGADLGRMLGAAHAFEIPFVFGHWDLGRAGRVLFSKENEPGRLTLGAQMASYWAEFAYAGRPGRGRDGSLPEWPHWPADDAVGASMVFDTAAGGGLRISPDRLRPADVIAAVATDARLRTQRERCTVYRWLAWLGRAYDHKDYAKACPDLPFEKYPWPS